MAKRRRPGYRADNKSAMQGFYSGPWTAHYIEEAQKIRNPVKRRLRLEHLLTQVFWQGCISSYSAVAPWFERLDKRMTAAELAALLEKRLREVPKSRQHTARIVFDKTPDYDGSEPIVMVTWLPKEAEQRVDALMEVAA